MFFDCYCESLISGRETGQWAMSPPKFKIFFSLLVIYIYTIFMGDTMYYLCLFIQAVRPVSHYVILMFQLGLMISVNVIKWS